MITMGTANRTVFYVYFHGQRSVKFEKRLYREVRAIYKQVLIIF